MSLKATSLKSSESQKKFISKEANGILAHMDDELKIAHDQGRHEISINVPISFAIPYMSNKDAQRAIYYKILTSLLDRGFYAEMELDPDFTIFHITWLSSDEKKHLDLQNIILAKHYRKKVTDVDIKD